MTRSSSRPEKAIRQAGIDLKRTKVVLVGVRNYQHLKRLPGTYIDTGHLLDLFTSNEISIFTEKQVTCHNDLACEQFRQLIIEYAQGCSGKGDVLILYFSGHGCVSKGKEFGFCLVDTCLDSDGNSALPLSIVPFSDVIRTLELFDIYPVIIIDACYSGMAVNEMLSKLDYQVSFPHAVISSSSYTSTSIETKNGGAFTEVFMDVLLSGAANEGGCLWPYFMLQHLHEPLRNEMIKRGLPQYQMYIDTSLPRIPLVKNVEYKPRVERFSPQYKGIVLLLWSNGKNLALNPNDFMVKLGTGATNNHSKLSYDPWALLEDDKDKKLRRLSKRGIDFVKGRVRIPKTIYKDPKDDDWKPHPDTELVTINEIHEPTWK